MISEFISSLTVGTVVFWLMSALAIVGAIGLITSKSPINALFFLVLNFFAIGGLYLTLRAEFLAVVQIIVYAGAILVLFLFVIMLLNLDEKSMEPFTIDVKRGAAYVVGLAFLAEMLFAFTGVNQLEVPTTRAEFDFGKVEPIGRQLMTDYVFPFEMVSIILLAALMGAVIIARRHN